MIDITKYNKFVRFPIYLPIFPLILMNPLSYSFSVLLYTEVFYLISVTCLEVTTDFIRALLYFLWVYITTRLCLWRMKQKWVLKWLIIQQTGKGYIFIKKRIFLPFFFFGLIFLSLSMLNQNKICGSLWLIFLSLSMLNQNKICGSLYTLIFAHAYLYYKFAIQIVMKICPETFIYNSMSFLGSSTCVILLLICIYKSKQSIVKSSL
jgi:hypothetical protein